MIFVLIVTQMFFIFGAVSASAQSAEFDAEKAVEYGEKIGIDYSMSDFSTSKIDKYVMGHRLLTILQTTIL